MEHHELAYIGQRTVWGGGSVLFGMKARDRRQHLYAIGKTGVGKTTLLRNLFVQDIKHGHGVGLLDPHGDLASELLDLIPQNRVEDVVYFNPSDLEFPMSMNILSDVPKDERHLVASGVISAFKSIWRDSWGPRMEYILYNAVATLLECENTTLLGISRILVDPQYRAWTVRQISDPFIRSFWVDEFENYDERFLREAIAPIQNKVGQFFTNPPIRNVLGQVRSKVSIPYVMDNRRIFIANLSKGKLGEDKANLLGSLLTTQFQLGAMARGNIPEEERKDFMLAIDEFHNFTTDSFTSILAEARKYRLGLTLSHQYMAQLNPSMRDAILGNVGSLLAFRVGHTDAEVLEKEFGNVFAASQFMDLGRHEILARLLEDGLSLEPFHAKTLPPTGVPTGLKEKIIARSREKFCTQRKLVEEKIGRWLHKDEFRTTNTKRKH